MCTDDEVATKTLADAETRLRIRSQQYVLDLFCRGHPWACNTFKNNKDFADTFVVLMDLSMLPTER